MSDIRSLENQIRQLQRELESQKREAERMRQNLANENLRKLQEYKTQMRTELNKHDKNVQKEYERLLKEYQKSANADIQKQQMQMDTKYQQLLMSTRQKEQEWKEKTKQLEQLINDLKKESQSKNEMNEKEADKYILEGEQAYREVNNKPHEKFFPKRIKTFYASLKEARMLQRQGLNEAAIAIAISTRSGVNRLGFDVDEKYDEWLRQYNLFQNKVELATIKLQDELLEWNTYIGEQAVSYKEMSRKDVFDDTTVINYWSGGIYNEIYSRVNELSRIVSDVEQLGIEKYLKKDESVSLEDLLKYINELDELDKRFIEMQQLYKQVYSASCERAEWGELIIDYMTDELNLIWIEEESHFKTIESDKLNDDYKRYMLLQYGKEYEQVDTREWLELVFVNSMDSKIFIYLAPYEYNLHVENRIIVYIDYVGAENKQYSKQIYDHICESIRIEDEDIINFATELEQLTMSMNSTVRDAGTSIRNKISKTKL